MKIQRNFWIYLAFSLLIGFLALYSHELFFQRVFWALGILIVLFFFWAAISLHGIEIKRVPFQQTRQVGTVFRESVEIKNRSIFFKFWIEVLDLSGLPGSKSSSVIFLLPPRSQRTYTSIYVLVKRGFFGLGPTQITSGDPLGLFRSVKSIKAEKKVVILPYTVQVHNFYNPPGRFSGGRRIQAASQDQTPHFSSIRDYKPGDSISRIHWKSTAKYGKLISKEFDQDPMSIVWIFLDGRKGQCHIGSPDIKVPEIDRHGNRTKVYDYMLPQNSFEYAVSAAGTIANFYLQQGRSVGLLINNASALFLSPERGQRQFGKIMQHLALAESDGELSIQAVIESQLPIVQNHCTAIVISGDSSKGLMQAYDALGRRGANRMIVLLDGSSFTNESANNSSRSPQSRTGTILIHYGDDLRKSLEG